jgi:hypothetical protein
MDIAEGFLRLNFDKDLNSYRSNDTLIEISSKRVSKLSGIKTLLNNCLHASLEDIIAFGDNYNDIEMLQAVGLGVAVANGREEVKLAAKEISAANTDDGVALTINKYFK